MADPNVYSLTAPVSASYLNLIVPRAVGKKGHTQGDPKFSANFRFKPDHPDLRGIVAMAQKVAAQKWPGRDLKTIKMPYAAGDKLADKAKAEGRDREEDRGLVILVSRSKFQPGLAGIVNGAVLDLTGDAIKAHQDLFYNGVEVFAQFNFQPYEGGGQPDGVTAYLNMVLSTGKGQKLKGGGGASAAETFSAYAGKPTAENPFVENDPLAGILG